jgi:hypothetical protein
MFGGVVARKWHKVFRVHDRKQVLLYGRRVAISQLQREVSVAWFLNTVFAILDIHVPEATSDA